MDTQNHEVSASREPYEAPKLIVIGPVTEFTFGSQLHDQSDNSLGFSGGHKTQ